MELRLPAPCVVVLIGPSGSGKTTWAQSHFVDNEIVSSDALRAMVGIDESDMTASTVAFDLLERIVAERLRRKLTTVIDTTGLDPDSRPHQPSQEPPDPQDSSAQASLEVQQGDGGCG